MGVYDYEYNFYIGHLGPLTHPFSRGFQLTLIVLCPMHCHDFREALLSSKAGLLWLSIFRCIILFSPGGVGEGGCGATKAVENKHTECERKECKEYARAWDLMQIKGKPPEP